MAPSHARPRAGSRRAAGLVVVRRGPDGWRCLVLRAFRNWDFPKGLVEPGETPLEAALRETREETSLSALRFPWGRVHRETEPYAGGKVARFHVAESPAGDVRLPVSEALGRPEHHEFRWASWEEARGLLVPRLQAVLDWARAIVEPATARPGS